MTPDLEARIDVSDLSKERAEEIQERGALLEPEGMRVWMVREIGLQGFKPPHLQVPEFHDYLSETADWGAVTWDFQPEGLRRMAKTLTWVYGEISEAFSFQAVWIGDPVEDVQATRPALLEIVAADAIGTGARYCVPAE